MFGLFVVILGFAFLGCARRLSLAPCNTAGRTAVRVPSSPAQNRYQYNAGKVSKPQLESGRCWTRGSKPAKRRFPDTVALLTMLPAERAANNDMRLVTTIGMQRQHTHET